MTSPPGKLPPLTDSAWFWVFMFSGVAMLGIIAVGPKYVRRQARAEQRYANRVQTWQHQQQAAEGSAESTELEAGRLMESQSPRASLIPLAAAVALVMAVAAGGLIVTRRSGG